MLTVRLTAGITAAILLTAAGCAAEKPTVPPAATVTPTTALADTAATSPSVVQSAPASTPDTSYDLSNFDGLDAYCAAAADYAANFVFPWENLTVEDPRVQAHYGRLDTLVAAAPPEHAADWAATVDIDKRMIVMEATSAEIADSVTIFSERLRPDILEFCGVVL